MVNKTAFLSTSHLISAKSIHHPRLEVENVINRSTVKDCTIPAPGAVLSSSLFTSSMPSYYPREKIKYSDCYYLFRGYQKNQTKSIFIHLKKSPVYDRCFIQAKLVDTCLREMLLLLIYSFVLLSVKLSSGVFQTTELLKLLQKVYFLLNCISSLKYTGKMNSSNNNLGK